MQGDPMVGGARAPARASVAASGIGHLVVGIGASAGGLRALKAFLAALPPGRHISLILAQHRAPQEEALLLDVLRPLTAMPVEPVVDGGSIDPDRLYVVPAGMALSLPRGRFRLRPVRGVAERRAPIDQLFRAIARSAGPCGVGLVLSGSGSDGALGLESIGAAGGLTMAQEPASAARPDMPESARAGGYCDHVAAPDALARILLAYADHVHALPQAAAAIARHRAIHALLPPITDVLRRHTGNDFRHYKPTTLMRRLERRMQVLQITEVGDYLKRLTADDAEAQTLFRELLIGVTAFFRDGDAFEALAEKALRPLLKDRSAGDELRIWVPGCASGEEAYSIAMLARELADEVPNPPRILLFATDINERALAIARRGSYPQGIEAQVSPARLERFFTRQGRRHQVSPELREMCLFSTHNLISDPPFSRLDLVSCRNLLIYMGPTLQKKLFPVFHYALKPGGYLFLGASESLAGHGELFRAVDARCRLSVRKDTRGVLPGGLRDFGGQGVPGLRVVDQMTDPDLGQIAQRILLTEFAPRYAVVGDQGQVLHLSEGADKYLQPPAGAFTGAITRMARRGLSAGLRSAFAESVQHRRAVTRELPAVQTSEGLQRVRLTVQPMPQLGHGEGLSLLVFEYAGATARAVAGEGGARPDAEALIETLESELARAREELERAVQDQEAANEELKSSNEELLSMNEELQSANEELEASKEEVQSAARSLELANADLANLLRSTRIATIFLDADGRIRGFTPAAADIYYLRAADEGRSLRELSHRLIDMPPLPTGPLRADAAVEDDARHEDGRWFLRRVLPYHGQDGVADGLLVTFVDISRQKGVEAQLRELAQVIEAMFEAVPGVLYAKDRDVRMTMANRACDAVVGKPFADYVGRTDAEFLADKAQGAIIVDVDRRIMADGVPVQIEEAVNLADGTPALWLSSKAPLFDAAGEVVGLVGCSINITQRHAAEAALRDSETRFAELADNIPVLCWMADADGSIHWYNQGWYDYTGTTPEQMTGWGWQSVHDPETLPAVMERWQGSIATGEPFEMAFPLRRADGAFGSFLTRVVPIRDDDGKVARWFGSNTDVSQQREVERQLAEALQTSDVLLHEVNHRVKNSLQIVTSLLMLQAGQARDPQLRQSLMEARGRIAVVASMHQRLYSTSQHDRVDFGDYLVDMAAETLRSLDGGGRITLDARIEQAVVMSLTQAVPLALVVSELVTNAVKYAFADGRAGRLTVALRPADNGIAITVADDGVGLPVGFDIAGRGGLGMRIVTALVRQVRGRLDVSSGEPGAVFTIVLPIRP